MPSAHPQVHSPAEEPIDESVLQHQSQSAAHMYRDRVAATPNGQAYQYAEVTPSGDVWKSVTWAEAKDHTDKLSAGLIALGVESEQRVAIASGTRLEWVYADLANMTAGAATTTIYPTTIADDVAFILSDSDSKVVFAEDAAQVDKLRSIKNQIGSVTKVVVFDTDGVDLDDWVMSLADLEEQGAAYLADHPGAIDERIEATTPEHLATLIYTSGTTGRPKGVRLQHSSWNYIGAAVESIGILGPDDLQYLWLPMAHVFGKMLVVLPIQMGFPTAVDGRIDKIVDNLAVVKPTFMGAAPRIFEKAYGRIKMMMEEEGGVKLSLQLGERRRQAGQRAQGAGQEPERAARPPARSGRQDHRRQDPRALRRQHPVLHLRLGGPQPGHLALVRRDGHADRRGLRHDREARPPRPSTA